MRKVILLRFGELYLKGKNKGFFERTLLNNIKQTLSEFDLKVVKISGRYLITDFDEKSIVGTITAEKNNTLFTTINYNKNWKVYIDSKPVKTFKNLDAFIGVEIPQGTHTVSFKFVQTSLYLGVFISLITLFGFIIALIKRRS